VSRPAARAQLSRLFLDRSGLQSRRGHAHDQRAVEQRADDGYIVDSLGWAYYRLGNMEEAVKQLERAIELKPEDPTIHDQLGDAYWRVGRVLEARFQWSHARPNAATNPRLAARARISRETVVPIGLAFQIAFKAVCISLIEWAVTKQFATANDIAVELYNARDVDELRNAE
jgi:tetratricopeptide (TPR) repeat protein